MATERDMFRMTTDTDETTFYIPPDEASVLKIESADGHELGISFHGDGTFVIAGWNGEGEWIELVPAVPHCSQPQCEMAVKFPLDQYTKAVAESFKEEDPTDAVNK